MKIINNRKIFYTISAILVIVSILAISIWGLNPGIDFKGGSLLYISYTGELPEVKALEESLSGKGLGEVSIRRAGENNYILRTRELNQDEKNEIINLFSFGGTHTPIEKEFNAVGPVLGRESLRKSYISIVLVLLAIVLFVTFAFRKVSKPVSSWIYGAVAIIALIHDVIIPTGVFSILGHFAGFEVDTLFVTALLVILGFSVHDTIVVFDRVRENLRKDSEMGGKKPFDQIVGGSISETFTRSINTSLTTLLAVLALYIFGPEATRHFAIALLIGITVGTYSSIFIGSPLLVTIYNFRNKR